MKTHSLIATLKSLTGNPRGCVYTEPLWGIPYNLYAPYISIYMVTIGLSDKQIGLILSISWGCQILLALISGVITDKMGRRRTTLIFDLLAWTIPSLISAIAQNFWVFLAAGVINSFWRITQNSWSCLLVEDADPKQLVDIYTWIYIANQIVGFIAPLAGILIATFTLVPTLRALYLFAAVMFTLKCVLTYQMTAETKQGQIRLHETKHQNMFSVLGEYRGVFSGLIRTSATLYAAGIMLVISIAALISNNFWSIILTQKLHIPNQNLAIFPFLKSAIILSFFFLVMPRLKRMHYKLPMVIGFIGYTISQMVLITAPEHGYVSLVLSVLLEACSFTIVSPLADQMLTLTVNPQERARIQSILYVGIILLTSPFGWIAGTLSAIDKSLPFILNIVLFLVGALLAYLAGQAAQKRSATESIIAS